MPYTVFIDPPLSRVGLTSKEAAAQRYDYTEHQLLVSAIPTVTKLTMIQGVYLK